MLFRLPRWTMIVLLIVSALFVIAGIGMVATGAQGGWPALAFFAACAAIFAAQLWPHLLVTQEREPVDTLLRRFPGPVELHVPQRKTLLILLCVIVFAGACAAYLDQERPGILVAGLIWFCLIVLVLSIPFVLYQFIRGASLRLEGDGFRIKAPWQWRFVRWKDASEFAIGSTSLVEQTEGDWSTVVTYDDANVDDSKKNILMRSITGRNSHLPDTYGLPAKELQALMNGWRALALRNA